MAKTIAMSVAAAAMVLGGLSLPTAASAHDRYQNHRHQNYDRYGSRYDNGYYNRAPRGRYYQNNYRQNYRQNYRGCDTGAGGTVIGAIAGGLAGHEIAGRGDRTVGAIIGGAVGAVAGRAIDRSNDGCRGSGYRR